MSDELFRQAVAAIDAGDVDTLRSLLAVHPDLVKNPITTPGAWLRDKIREAADGFFRNPYLLWFVAEDPVRNGTLPANIAAVTQIIIDAAKREHVANLQDQLDHTLRLVCWSPIAPARGVQIDLIRLLLDAGASLDGRTVFQGRFGTHTDAAIYNGNLDAARYLSDRGAPMTLSTALCLERWADVDRLAANATLAEKQDAFILAALNGKAAALRKMLSLGIDPTTASKQNQSHGTALHHAVWSGSLEAVKVLVAAGADVNRRDTIYQGTPLGWALYSLKDRTTNPRAEQFEQIAAYLRERGAQE